MKINKIVVENDLLGSIEERYSCWFKLKRIIALVQKWEINTEQKKEIMLTRSKKVLDFPNNNLNLLDVELLQEAEKFAEKMVQSK